MEPCDELIRTDADDNSAYCFAKPGHTYLVYIAKGKQVTMDLSDAAGDYTIQWFNPRDGGPLQNGSVRTVAGGGEVNPGQPPADREKDWLVVVRHAKLSMTEYKP